METFEPYIIERGSADYPPILEQLKVPPARIWVRGAPLAKLLKKPRVAVVGTRRISPYGQQVTTQMTRSLAELGVVIVSGLALGVDGAAHRAALECGGLTVAVLPTPIDTIVPGSHRRLAYEILSKGGALVSHYPPGRESTRNDFVERNQIMAALAQAVVITEAGLPSGAIHTATFARQLNVPTYAVPGNITSPTSAGTNKLLTTDGAMALTDYKEVLRAIGQAVPRQKRRTQAAAAAADLTPGEQQILKLLADLSEADGDALLIGSGLSAASFNQALTTLEFSGRVRPLGLNRWGLC